MSDQVNGLKFNNPVEVSEEEFGNLLGLDFSSFGEKEEKEDETPVPPKTKLNVKTSVKEEDDETEDEENEEDTNTGLNPLKEEVEKKPIITSSDGIINIMNTLAETIGFDEVYEGFDEDDDVTEDTLLKFIEHNTSKKIDESLVSFFDNLSDATKRIVSYDINSKGQNIESYLRTLLEEQNIKSLSLENEYDQEKIVKQFYKNTGDFTPEEIEEKIADLKDASQLDKEAKRLKPKLDQMAEKIAKDQEESMRRLREIEQNMSQDYTDRVIETLKTGVIGGIKLNKNEIADIYSYLTDDKIEVTVHNGKKAEMSPLDAIIFYNKYDKKNGSIENLALATLLLTNPKKFDEVYAKKSMTKVTEDFIKSTKWSDSIKIGGGETKKSTGKKKESNNNKDYAWSLNI